MNSAFFHFWLAERGDLFDPVANPRRSLPATPGAERGHSGGRNPFPQGRAAAAHLLHADRAASIPTRSRRLTATIQACRSWIPSRGQGGHTMKTRTAASTARSAGITLTEILISILILGVGLVSLATLFPIGLLRLREAQRQTRSAYLFQSATADVASRGLLSSNSFIYADLLNPPNGFNLWYYSQVENVEYNPLIQDTPAYGADPFAVNPNAPPPTFPLVPPRPVRAVTACPSRMIRSGGIRPATILTRSARPCPRPDSRRVIRLRAHSCGPIRRTKASPAPMACSGSRTSTGRR